MAKWYGKIGYARTEPNDNSIWEETVFEKPYYGDMIRHTIHANNTSEQLNDNVVIRDELSVIADHFAFENASMMRYATYLGAKWKITSISVKYPRLNLTLGGVYNGPKPDEGGAAQTGP